MGVRFDSKLKSELKVAVVLLSPCDLYGSLKKDCVDPAVDPVKWLFDHSGKFVLKSRNVTGMESGSKFNSLSRSPVPKLICFGMLLDDLSTDLKYKAYDELLDWAIYAHDELTRSTLSAVSVDGMDIGSLASKGLEFPEIEGSSFTASTINSGRMGWRQHLDEIRNLRSVSQANLQSGSFELRRLNPSSDSAAVAAVVAAAAGGSSGGSTSPIGNPGGASGGGQSRLPVAVPGGDDGDGDENHPQFNQGITLDGLVDALYKFLYAFTILLYHMHSLWRALTGPENVDRNSLAVALENLHAASTEFVTALANLWSYKSALRAKNWVFLPLLLALIVVHPVLCFCFMQYFGHFE